MAEQLVLTAHKREGRGGGRARRLRKTGAVPGVVYSDGAPAEVIQIDAHDFGLILQHHGESMILTLAIEDGEPVPVLLKDVQHHPVSGDLLHADFLKISMTEMLETHVPIHLTGEAEGVKLGGVLDQSLFELQIEGLPGDIPESIDVDVSAMEIGDHLTVADIALPAGLTVIAEGDLAVASVLPPRLEEDAEPEEGEGGADAEPEVIKAKHETEEEE
jgi:large subunit ribosomal protein L25